MARLQQDFLGPFVECNGSINRPATASRIRNPVKVAHIRCTPSVKVTDVTGITEIWYACGQAAAYRAARRTLPPADFEAHVTAMAGCANNNEVIEGGFYPRVNAMFPNGYADFRSALVHKAIDQERQLRELPLAAPTRPTHPRMKP